MFTMPPCFNAGDTIYFPFDTYDSNGASVTISGLAVTDIEVYKNGSTTQRSSDNGYALLDTDGIDFDSTTGLHGFSIDTSDNSDSGFWADGSQYWVHVNAITVDSQTVRFTYLLPLGYLLRPTTAGRKLDVSSGGEAGVDWANVGSPTTTVNLSGTTVKDATDVNTDTDALLTRLTSTRAGYLDNLSAGAVALESTAQSILTDTAEIGAAGAGLTNINLPNQTMDIVGNITGNLSGSVGSVTGNVGGNVTGSVGSLATQAKADVNAEVDSAIETYHLDHLLAADYDPSSKPGVSTALLNEIVENDGGVSRFTANALEQAPSGGGGGNTYNISTSGQNISSAEV